MLHVLILYCAQQQSCIPPATSLGAQQALLPQELSFVEFFAGQGNVWRAVRADSHNCVGIDIEHGKNVEGGKNPFDILSDAGFGFHP